MLRSLCNFWYKKILLLLVFPLSVSIYGLEFNPFIGVIPGLPDC